VEDGCWGFNRERAMTQATENATVVDTVDFVECEMWGVENDTPSWSCHQSGEVATSV
jgi:hypothetical protein